MKFLYEYWFCIYLRTRANTRADIVPVTLSALFRPQKTYFLLSEGSKSLIIMFFLFPELNSIKNVTMLKKLPDHFKRPSLRLFRFKISQFVPFWLKIRKIYRKYAKMGQIVKSKYPETREFKGTLTVQQSLVLMG